MSIGKTAEYHIRKNPGLKNAELLALVLKDHAGAKTTEKCITWYKADLRKRGIIAKKAGGDSKYAGELAKMDAELAAAKAAKAEVEAKLAKLEAAAKK